VICSVCRSEADVELRTSNIAPLHFVSCGECARLGGETYLAVLFRAALSGWHLERDASTADWLMQQIERLGVDWHMFVRAVEMILQKDDLAPLVFGVLMPPAPPRVAPLLSCGHLGRLYDRDDPIWEQMRYDQCDVCEQLVPLDSRLAELLASGATIGGRLRWSTTADMVRTVVPNTKQRR